MPNSLTIQNLCLDFCTWFILFKIPNLIPSISFIPFFKTELKHHYPVNITLKSVFNYLICLSFCISQCSEKQNHKMCVCEPSCVCAHMHVHTHVYEQDFKELIHMIVKV